MREIPVVSARIQAVVVFSLFFSFVTLQLGEYPSHPPWNNHSLKLPYILIVVPSGVFLTSFSSFLLSYFHWYTGEFRPFLPKLQITVIVIMASRLPLNRLSGQQLKNVPQVTRGLGLGSRRSFASASLRKCANRPASGLLRVSR